MDWHALQREWEASPEQAASGLPHDVLAPTWQMLLLGDGSPTKLLQLLTTERTVVDVLAMDEIGDAADGAPADVSAIPGPRLRRQVFLRAEGGRRLGYATSWWNADEVNSYLRDSAKPIWRSLAANRTELYRDIRAVYSGRSAALEEAFGCPGPFWGRHYLFWHKGRPLTLIYEVFSPGLGEWLGPSVRLLSADGSADQEGAADGSAANQAEAADQD